MMKFKWDRILSKDEKIKKEFGISNYYLAVIFVITIIAAALTISTGFGISLTIFFLGLFYCFYLKKSRHYAFTNKRVILVDSFIGANIVSVEYDKITDVQIDQAPIDQILGWGNLIINTAGTHSPFMSMPYVENPNYLKKVLTEIAGNKS
jgi:membrane protein YdbS with pleckstrin-like domain